MEDWLTFLFSTFSLGDSHDFSHQAKEEIDNEKLRAEAAASVLAKKTKSMQEQVSKL